MIMNRFSGSQFYEHLGVSIAIILVEMEHKDAVERRERRAGGGSAGGRERRR